MHICYSLAVFYPILMYFFIISAQALYKEGILLWGEFNNLHYKIIFIVFNSPIFKLQLIKKNYCS